jgi:hypothetical protein
VVGSLGDVDVVLDGERDAEQRQLARAVRERRGAGVQRVRAGRGDPRRGIGGVQRREQRVDGLADRALARPVPGGEGADAEAHASSGGSARGPSG